MPEVDQWQFEAAPCHQVCCRQCGWETSADGAKEEAVAELKRLGWKLMSDGPWCPECILEDELSKDDSEVYPK
jgi:hypothetical protein